MPVKWNFKYIENASDYFKTVQNRLSDRSLMYIQTRIVAAIIHAEITEDFRKQGRPIKWPALSPIYSKIKKSTSVEGKQFPMSQPPQLGIYPTPWGNINVKYGQLYNTLGTVLQITPTKVSYGTTTPYAGKVQSGFNVQRIAVSYERNGKTISYYKSVNTFVPARPFDYVSDRAQSSISQSIADYIASPTKARQILIPSFGITMLVTGGRQVPIRK